MISPPVPANDKERVKKLRAYSILDTLPEGDFDNITALASRIFNTPISGISLIDEDRQWLKSKVGLKVNEIPRQHSFCSHAINHPGRIMVVEDAKKDSRFSQNPLVTGDPYIGFYAGASLVTAEGHALGTICIADTKPGIAAPLQLDILELLSKQVIKLFELRKTKMELEKTLQEVDLQNEELNRFAQVVSHDLRGPLSNIRIISNLLREEYAPDMDNNGRQFIDYLDETSLHLVDYVGGILRFSRSLNSISDQKVEFDLSPLMKKVIGFLPVDKPFEVIFPEENQRLYGVRIVLEQIMINLLANAIRYCDKPVAVIKIDFYEDAEHYYFSVEDNGPGIPEEDRERAFDLFQNLNREDHHGVKGTGIGLATVKRLVNMVSGEISIATGPEGGAQFNFYIRR